METKHSSKLGDPALYSALSLGYERRGTKHILKKTAHTPDH